MRGTLRRHLPSVVALVIAISVVPIGLFDHRYKQTRINRAEAKEWYCVHLGTRCNGPSSSGIEKNWNRREAAYVALLVALPIFATLRLAVQASRRPARGVRKSSS